MRQFATTGVVVGICLLAPAARAADQAAAGDETPPATAAPRSGRLFLSARTGYAWPLPSTGWDVTAADIGQVPIWVDVGYKLTSQVMLGAYGQYGIGVFASRCANQGCSATELQGGAQIQYQFSSAAPIEPWLGFGLGYEWTRTSITEIIPGGSQHAVRQTASGLSFALQAGLDFKLAPAAGVGPFTTYSLGEYTGCTHAEGIVRVDCSLSTGVHGWWTLGLRAAFEL